GDVVTRADDHVVGARLINEVTVVVDKVGVAGEIPAVAHVIRLPIVGEIAASGRTLDREPADATRRQRLPFIVHHTGVIARHGYTCRTGSRMSLVVRNEDVEHFSGADAVAD